MSSFCEFCGNRVEDGQVCACPDATAARGAQPAAAPPPPQQQAPQGGYAPPPPPQQAPPPGQYPPPNYGAPGQQPPPPGYGQQPPPGYGQQPYGYGPPQGQTGQQVKQTFGDVKNTLTGFVKDPYGAAMQSTGLRMPVSLSLLGVQAVTFFLMMFGVVQKIVSLATRGLNKEYKKMVLEEMGVDFGFYMKVLFGGIFCIAVFFGVLFLATKIAKIAASPQSLLSSLSMSSIPMSAGFLLLMILILLFGTDKLGVGLCVLVLTFALVSSCLLLEIGLRGAMPAGTGNISRLMCLAASYAVTYAVNFIILVSFLEDSFFAML